MGCMTISIGIKKLDSLVQDAVSKGAKLLHGGKLRKTDRAEQLFWEPTILADANHSMSVVTDEAFGPIMTILKFASDDELITLANGTRYGLGLSVYSRDYARAEKLVKEIKSGMAVINDFGLGYLIQALPFGGVKASGFGKFNGPEGLREFCVCRTIVSDRIPGAYSRTPPFLQMPVSEKSYHIMRCVIALIYGVGIPTKLSAIGSLISGKGQASANKKQD
jgi:acyl-CoA reductase-like NAD-dependent aldehyde dehydrogenase